jgi:hypothetical protein
MTAHDGVMYPVSGGWKDASGQKIWLFLLLFKINCWCLQVSMDKLQEIQKAMMMDLLNIQGQGGAPKSIEEAQRKRYEFWDTQPVPKLRKFDSIQFNTIFYCSREVPHGSD